jgi:hypothetical protein
MMFTLPFRTFARFSEFSAFYYFVLLHLFDTFNARHAIFKRVIPPIRQH